MFFIVFSRDFLQRKITYEITERSVSRDYTTYHARMWFLYMQEILSRGKKLRGVHCILRGIEGPYYMFILYYYYYLVEYDCIV